MALLSATTAAITPTALLAAGSGSAYGAGALVPGNLLVSTSTYPTTPPTIVPGTTQLPPGCTGTACKAAVADGTYPYVFDNAAPDGSFGVTSPITLQQITPSGVTVSSMDVPNSTQAGVTSSSDQMVTSFSSKSELALNQSTDGTSLSFMGYNAPVAALDVSNSNTPGEVDSTNPVKSSSYRVVAELGADGTYHFTETTAYSGNNGRAAILNSGTGQYYAAGNAGNGKGAEPQTVVSGAGSQLIAASTQPESAQAPGAPTPMGNFSITQLGDPADKSAKDDNFRGVAVSNNVVYYSKGSGGNGVNTVYFVDTSGSACPNGVGLPSTSATLPTAANPATPHYSVSDSTLHLTASNPGLTPTNMCILKGFTSSLATPPTTTPPTPAPPYFPFGMFFASPTVLYVADEGSGSNTYAAGTYTDAAASTTAGLEKWVFDGTQWNLAYTLQSGLNLGVPQTTIAGYPTGLNNGEPGHTATDKGTGLPWAPATDGLRNLAGEVNADGTVSLYAATSTVSGSGDQGTDPNQLVAITDSLAATTLPATETFSTVIPAANAVVVRGVTFTPGTTATPPASTPEVPWAPLAPIAAGGVLGLVYWSRSRRSHRGLAA